METNVSKLRRDQLLEHLERLRGFAAGSGEESSRLLFGIAELEKEVRRKKKYGLVFEAYRESAEEALDVDVPVLTEKKKLLVENGGQLDFLIEGDNLAVLRLLEKTHKGKVDMVYIDPPYNTGANDFIYGDNFVNKEDAYLHSKWLSFMEPRLKAAKALLREEGCILISINENEAFQLKLLCDEIFGYHNYLTTFAVKVRHEDRILKGDKDFHEVFEYLLFYRRSPKHRTSKKLVDNTSNRDYVYSVMEKTGSPRLVELGGKQTAVFAPDEFEVVKAQPDFNHLKKINIRGSIKEGNSSGRFFMRHLNELIGEKPGYLYKVPDMGDDGLGFRYFLIPDKASRKNGDYFQGVPQNREDVRAVPYANLLDFEASFNSVGYEGGVEFRNGKKPIAFLMKCFDLAGMSSGNKTVLDFFAGSGSTGHALLEYNKLHGLGNRFILATNNQNGICREITYERLKKMITENGYRATLKYYKAGLVKAGGKMYYEYADELLGHIRELVELRYGMDFLQNGKVALVLDDGALDSFVRELERYPRCELLLAGYDVLPDAGQEEALEKRGITVQTVPDCYYSERR